MGLYGFIRTVLIIVAFYYLFKFIGRVVIPYLLAKGINKMNNRFQQKQHHGQNKNAQEGRVTIQKNKKDEKMTTPDMGEYVDYEEIK